MHKGRKLSVIFMVILLQGCFGAGSNPSQQASTTNAVLAVALLPLKIVGVAVAAAIGAAAGMGMMEGNVVP